MKNHFYRTSIMKKLNHFLSLIIAPLYMVPCQAISNGKIHWKEDGHIFSSEGKSVMLDMQSIYDGIEHQGNAYVIGFQIDKEGINTPSIAEISADLANIRYWPFNSIINDIFIYRGSVYINDISGKVLVFNAPSWQQTDLIFPENGKVVFGDGNNTLVICHSASLPKNADHNSGCYSISSIWKYQFTWFTCRTQSLQPRTLYI